MVSYQFLRFCIFCQDMLLQRYIMQSQYWNTTSKKLPKRIDPRKPGYVFRRQYGIPSKMQGSVCLWYGVSKSFCTLSITSPALLMLFSCLFLFCFVFSHSSTLGQKSWYCILLKSQLILYVPLSVLRNDDQHILI